MRRLRFTPLAAIAALALAAGAALGDPCPPSGVRLYTGPVTWNTQAVFDTSDFSGSGGWDMPAGYVHMYSTGTLAGVVVDMYDDFDVTGVAPGTPVTVQARLSVDGAVWTTGCGGSGCGGMYEVAFWHGTDSLRVLHSDHLFSGRTDHHDELVLPVTITAGTPERLRVYAHGQRTPGGAHQSEAHCRLTFVVQDAAIGVVSCKTYSLAPVPTRPTSWGRLKSLYR